jgi:hypothetical protein
VFTVIKHRKAAKSGEAVPGIAYELAISIII